MVQLETISKFINRLPGDRYLGPYRFLPIFFGMGAAIEFLMIKWTITNTNFCKYFICLSFGKVVGNLYLRKTLFCRYV